MVPADVFADLAHTVVALVATPKVAPRQVSVVHAPHVHKELPESETMTVALDHAVLVHLVVPETRASALDAVAATTATATVAR